MTEIPYLEEYLNYMKIVEMISDNTLKNYPIHLRHFFEFTEGRYNVNAPTINKYIEYLLDKKKYARTTVNAKLACLRSYYNYLYNNEIIERNIAEKIQLLSLEEKEQLKLPSQKEIFKILDGIKDLKQRAILETLYATGMRESECSNLNIENIDFEYGLVTILKAKGRNGGKTRVNPISDTALTWIKAYIGSRKKGPLFLNNRNGRMGVRSIYNIVTQNFNFPPHILRHCFATHMIIKTGNIKAVSQLLGHANTQVTEKIYTHINSNDLSNIYKQGGMDR